ncbi:hypothetical protein VUR80DRAFT_6935 [Thermomyces stellatus]
MSSRRSRPQKWSNWGEWIWSDANSGYYSQRPDAEGQVETKWLTGYDAEATPGWYGYGDNADDNGEGTDDSADIEYAPKISTPYAGEASKQAAAEYRSSETSKHADSKSHRKGDDRRSSKSHRKRREDDDAKQQQKKSSHRKKCAHETPHSAGTSARAGSRERGEARGSRRGKDHLSKRSGGLAGAEHCAVNEVSGEASGSGPLDFQRRGALPEDSGGGYRYPDMDKSYYHNYDYNDDQGDLGFRRQHAEYNGMGQGPNGPFGPWEEDSDHYYPGSPHRGYKITSGGDGEQDEGAQPRYYGSHPSEDEESDRSLQSGEGKSRRKEKGRIPYAPSRHRGGHPGSHHHHDNDVSYSGDDGKLHEGIGKNRGRQGERGQNDRDAQV